MKKRIVTAAALVIALAFGTQGFAQKKYPASFVSLNGGAAIPTGNFSKADYDNDASGFAKTGYQVNVAGTYYFKKSNWGIAAQVGYSGYGFKGAQQLADGFKDGFDVDSTTLYRKGKNHSLSILAGPAYGVVCSRFTLQLHAMAGYVRSGLAGYQVFLEDQEGNEFTQAKATAGSFGWQAGAGLQYRLCKHFAVTANADYFYSKPDFTIDNINRPIAAGRKIDAYHEAVAGINATLGLVYLF